MSSRRHVALSTEAQADLRELLAFSQRRWGIPQRRGYRRHLFDAFAHLAAFPELGLLAVDYGDNRRRYRVGQHVVVYEVTASEIRVLRLIHVRRDQNAIGESGAPE